MVGVVKCPHVMACKDLGRRCLFAAYVKRIIYVVRSMCLPTRVMCLHRHVVICIPCLLLGGSERATLSMVKALKTQGDHDITRCCYYEHEAVMVTQFEQAGTKVDLLGMTRGSVRHLLSALVDLFRSQRPTPDALQTSDRAPCRRSLHVC
jgi:hypothetical protein